MKWLWGMENARCISKPITPATGKSCWCAIGHDNAAVLVCRCNEAATLLLMEVMAPRMSATGNLIQRQAPAWLQPTKMTANNIGTIAAYASTRPNIAGL